MNSKVDAIVLKTAPHKENDILLSLLTMSSGRIDALVRGAKKSRRSVLYTQPFSYSELSLYRAGRQGLYIVDGAEPKENFYELRKNLSALALAQYFSEACYYLPKESSSGDEDKFMKLLLNSLYILCKKKDISVTAVKLVFELKFAKYLGFSPDFSACVACGKNEGVIWKFDRGIFCSDCGKEIDGYKINDSIRKIITHALMAENMSAYCIFADEKALLYIDSIVEKYFSTITERNYRTLDYYRELREIEASTKKGNTNKNE